MTEAHGIAGRLAAAFVHSKLTPLTIVASLLLGDAATSRDADLRALQQPELTEQQFVQARVVRQNDG